MKYIKLAILASLMLFASCKKENASRPAVQCFECDFGSINEGQAGYIDVGCMTAQEWQAVQFYDNTGNVQLNKAAHCKLKQ